MKRNWRWVPVRETIGTVPRRWVTNDLVEEERVHELRVGWCAPRKIDRTRNGEECTWHPISSSPGEGGKGDGTFIRIQFPTVPPFIPASLQCQPSPSPRILINAPSPSFRARYRDKISSFLSSHFSSDASLQRIYLHFVVEYLHSMKT